MHPILVWTDGGPVHCYGVLVAAGYLAGILWLWSRRREVDGGDAEFWALVYTIFFCAILGAKLGYLLLDWKQFRGDPAGALRDWRSGWVFWTGFAATMAGGWVFQRVYNRTHRPRRYLPVADYFGPALALGHTLGRLGCFLEGCCHGRPTALPWGVRFTDPSAGLDEAFRGVALHPTQLYEAFGEAAIFAFMLAKVLPGIRKGRYAYGTAFFGYILLYSVLRFVVEFFRGDDRGTFFLPWLSPSQWFSLAGLLLAAYALRRNGILEKDPEGRSLYL